MRKLKSKKVSYEDLLLDANNPRLADDFVKVKQFTDDDIEGRQKDLERRFSDRKDKPSEQEETDHLIDDTTDEFFSVQDLKDSMRQIGFVKIQNVIVRPLQSSKKYVVIEGNRRIAAIKAVIKEHNAALPGAPNRIEDETILGSLESIEVMVLQVKGLSNAEVENLISMTLGMRHYGGNLKWELLPRAKNIYDEYVKQIKGAFAYVPAKGKAIADVLAISQPEVRKLLRGFVCYRQLSEIYSKVNPRHFSLILACIENRNLSSYGFIEIDDSTFELRPESVVKINELLEFDERDSDDYPKTVQDTKELSKFARLIKESVTNDSSTIKGKALGLSQDVLDKETPLDDAHNQFLNFVRKEKWTDELDKLLERQKIDPALVPDKFLNRGVELEFKESLRKWVNKALAAFEA